MEHFKINGVHVWLRNMGDQAVAGEIIQHDFYKLRELWVSGLEPKVIVDIGAHVGTFAAFAHALWPEATIVCAEPVRENFEVLKRNAPFARLHNCAIRHDMASLFITTQDATGGGFVATIDTALELAEKKHGWDGFRYEVMGDVVVRPLWEILDEEDILHIDLLKLDCEGSEFDIMKQMWTNVGMCIGEYHCEGGFPEFKAVAEKSMPQLEFYGGTRDPIGPFYSRPCSGAVPAPAGEK